eukprot:EST48831.1 DNA replication licensing factor MCM5 [Spironucleus salmonicida]
MDPFQANDPIQQVAAQPANHHASWTTETFVDRFSAFLTNFRDPDLGYIYQIPPYNISLEYVQQYDYELYDAISLHPFRSFSAANQIGPATFHFTSVHSAFSPQNLSNLNVNKLISVRGIAVSTSTIQSKIATATGICRSCGAAIKVEIQNQIEFPVSCKPECGKNPYILNSQLSVYKDVQNLKIAAVSSLEKTLSCTLENAICDEQILAGNELILTGILTPKSNFYALNCLGVTNFNFLHHSENFTVSEINIFKKIQQPIQYIAPHISGHENIKLAICLMLVQGTTKFTPDGSRMRGQIHVLLLSDPGVGKSELLKTASKLSKISVLTSGRGTTSAGLTAAVIRDSLTGEYNLEGGALVVANNGILCLDEFDKARAEDVVALHEAMEQGTISVSKAGVQTILSTKVSVFAAANPVFGRYDELKSISEQIDLPETIASRFDLIFLMKDLPDEKLDYEVAGMIYEKKQSGKVEFDEQILMRFFQYCQSIQVIMSKEAEVYLTDFYVNLRKQNNVLPVTVRQLEGLIRLSEAITKLDLRTYVTVSDAEKAVELYVFSCQNIQQSELGKEISKSSAGAVNFAMGILRSKMALKMVVNEKELVRECAMIGGQEGALVYALGMMVQNGEIERVRGRQVMRVK